MDYVAREHHTENLGQINLRVASFALFDLFNPGKAVLFKLFFENFDHVNKALLVEGMGARFTFGLPVFVSRRKKERFSNQLLENAHRESSLVVDAVFLAK